MEIKKKKIASRHKKLKDQDIIHLLLPSLLSIVACMVLLGGSTWAYFIATLPQIDHKIEAANYDILVDVSFIEDGQVKKVVPLLEDSQTYSFETGKEYNVTLTAQGSATTGYGVLFVKSGSASIEDKYYTNQISQGDNMTFLLISNQNITCSFVPSWGTYTGSPDVSNGETFEIITSANSVGESLEEKMVRCNRCNI